MATTERFDASSSTLNSSLNTSDSIIIGEDKEGGQDTINEMREKEQLGELDRELVSFTARVTPSVDDIMSHKVVLDLVRDVARRVLDPSADIEMFGSAASGLCERGSDIDATVIVDFAILNKRFHGNSRSPSPGHETRLLCSEAVCAIAQYIENSNGTGLAVEGLISGAKVPIVVLSSFGRQIIDVSINNILPTFNTKLFGEYAKLDDRVVSLVLSVKRWAKMAQVSDAKMGNLSSYSWSILCLYYLQVVGVIPSLQARAPPGIAQYQCTSTGKTFDVTFLSGEAARVEKSLIANPTSLCVASLLCGFFAFYDSAFRWGDEVVSIRVGGSVRKGISDPEFAQLSQESRTMMDLPHGVAKIHIEDPFDLTRNLHCVMDVTGLICLRKAFRDISAKLVGAPVSVLASLSRTLMSYKNVVPAFSSVELNKRYNNVGIAVVRGSPQIQAQAAPLAQIGEEKAAAIVRNYAKQQEILEKHLLTLQQRQHTPGRGSYRQSADGGIQWHTVDLW